MTVITDSAAKPLPLNLAELAISGPNGDAQASIIASQILDDYYAADKAAFAAENLKPLSFRDAPMHKAVQDLENAKNLSPEQQGQLSVLKEAITLEEQLLLMADIVPVAVDIHHWRFTSPDGLKAYHFAEPAVGSLVAAWQELRYAGLLSNPQDPLQPAFGSGFVTSAERLAKQAEVFSVCTGLRKDRILKSVFVNAAQVLGRRIVNGTPEGQVAPQGWVELAGATKAALDLK